MTKRLQGFIDFIRQQGVVGLAIGLAIGTQATVVVKDIVSAVIDPLVGLLIGNSHGLQAAVWNVAVGGRQATFAFGKLAYSWIVFVSVAAVIYFIVMGLRLDKLDKKKQ